MFYFLPEKENRKNVKVFWGETLVFGIDSIVHDLRAWAVKRNSIILFIWEKMEVIPLNQLLKDIMY